MQAGGKARMGRGRRSSRTSGQGRCGLTMPRRGRRRRWRRRCQWRRRCRARSAPGRAPTTTSPTTSPRAISVSPLARSASASLRGWIGGGGLGKKGRVGPRGEGARCEPVDRCVRGLHGARRGGGHGSDTAWSVRS